MPLFREFRTLTRIQRNTFTACFLGWTLDSFDFFLLTFCLKAIAADFHVGVKQVAEAIFWTLVMRPIGALLFGAMAERYGRRPTLMLNVVAFSVFELASAFAPTLHSFLVCRALFGVAMGGVWGVGAALALETLPARGRGFFSGLLQEGYVVGNLLAATLFGLFFPHLHGSGMMTNWRVMFMVGALPALLAFYLQCKVKESPVWLASRDRRRQAPSRSFDFTRAKYLFKISIGYLPSFLFLVVLMTAFTSFSHGTQDLYPTFLLDRGLSDGHVGLVAAIANIGAFIGGICCGALSEKLGRRKTILLAALFAIPMVPLWAWSHSMAALAVGGFLMQFMVQGAWGIVPAHLNELAPGPVRAVFPGVAYQLGNLLSSRNAVFQAAYASRHNGGALNVALSATVVIVAIAVATVAALGPEAKGSDLAEPTAL
ncbi:MAG TPA: MFS transporter [Acidobacteriaceae bacterium]|nr:MFS transporter [Acidobacteriaceae bacterium]